MTTDYSTYNYIIPAYGHSELTERIAREVADGVFAAQGGWAIKSSDAFVTLFFSCPQDAIAFHRSWLSETAATPPSSMSKRPEIKLQAHVERPATAQGAVLPDVPMAPLTEYLRLGPMGGMGWNRICRWEVYAPGAFRNTYMTDPRSEFTSRVEGRDWLNLRWNAATVLHEGSERTMLWTRDFRSGSRNEAAIDLLRNHFVQGSGLLSSHDAAFGDVYFVLNQTWKPFIDIVRTGSESAFHFRKVARPFFTGWWHAVSIKNGWRIFSDSLTEMTYAKLALSS